MIGPMTPAYRMSVQADLFDFAAAIRPIAQDKLISIGKKFYEAMLDKPPVGMAGKTPLHCMMYMVEKLDQKHTTDLMAAINVGILVRRLESHYYLVPYCEFMGVRDVLNFLGTYPGVEDFSYDPDRQTPFEGISIEQWSYRATVWNKLYENWGNHHIEIQICDYLTWFEVLDPWMDMMKDSLSHMTLEQKRQYLASIQG